ncbi:MAG: hypothetical protein ACAI44_38330 [Candidatus Sericytochromatia bacterium]
MSEHSMKTPRRWQMPIAGLLMLLVAAPLFNAGVMLIYEQTVGTVQVHGNPSPLQGWLALAAGLGLMALCLWLFAAEIRRQAKTGWARVRQSLGYISFVLISLGVSGAGLSSAPTGGFYTLYSLCALTGLGLSLVWFLAEVSWQLIRRISPGSS